MRYTVWVNDYLIQGTAANHTLRVLALQSKHMVQYASDAHQLSSTATAALGRLLTGSVLFARALNKHAQSRVTLKVEGGGSIGYLLAEGSPEGTARGYVQNPSADLPPRSTDGKLDVGGIVGSEGELSITRLLENTEPYTSTTPLQSGEIADDLTYYLAHSEQIPSALLLGVYIEGGAVHTAGGLLIQAMPEVEEATLRQLEANIQSLGTITEALRGRSLLEVIDKATENLGFEQQGNALSVRFACRCSKEKALNSLSYFDTAEREDMVAQGGQEVVCHWCNHKYHLSPEDIAKLPL